MASVPPEHVHRNLCMNNCSSAPRRFRVWGRVRAADAAEPAVLLGEFEYDLFGDTTVQTFALPLPRPGSGGGGGVEYAMVTLEVRHRTPGFEGAGGSDRGG